MSKLTIRQREIYSLIVQGYTQRAIANRLNITPRTVKAHYAGIRQRTDSNSIVEAAVKLSQSSRQ